VQPGNGGQRVRAEGGQVVGHGILDVLGLDVVVKRDARARERLKAGFHKRDVSIGQHSAWVHGVPFVGYS